MNSRQLILGVDIRDLRIAKTGTKTYLEELCKEFKKLEDESLKVVFFDTFLPVYIGENKIKKLVEHIRYHVWKQLLLPIRAKFKGCDILFCTDNVVPLMHLGFKPIPVIHDAFFFENPEHYNRIWLWLFRTIAIPAAKRAPVVITVSNYSKERIAFFTGIPLQKIIPVYEGPKTFDYHIGVTQDNLLENFKITAKKYLLHVGVMDKRKNIPALIRAFKLLKSGGYQDIKLVLVGNSSSKKHANDYELIAQTIKKNHLEHDIVFTGYLNDSQLQKIYQHALLYVFPSINEGFGVPVLEAFNQKIPVLVSNNTSLTEVGGDAVVSFNPFSDEDIYLKIKQLIDEDILREELILKGTERLKLFSWRKAAVQLINIFKDVPTKQLS